MPNSKIVCAPNSYDLITLSPENISINRVTEALDLNREQAIVSGNITVEENAGIPYHLLKIAYFATMLALVKLLMAFCLGACMHFAIP
ncbi:MAG: hypothetical protein JSV15_03720 [Candidatus Bathyarchaeota archaeon]|nr:MAG: hypothetical protein JSV15_03720 [Candidatus Bathyarchaeota archaeon]